MESEKKTDNGTRTKPTKDELSVIPVQVAMGVSGNIIVSVVAYMAMRSRVPVLENPCDRLLYTIRWLFLSGMVIFVMAFNVARIRGQSAAINPLTGHEHFVEVANRILRNTVEQFLLHAVGLVTLSTFLRADSMVAVPMFVSLFVIGRLVYWWGYSRNAMWRGPGWEITVFPTTGLYIYCCFCLCRYGFAYKG